MAGPSCAGKSTLIDKISNGRLPPSIYEQLELQNKDLSAFSIVADNDIRRIMLEQLDDSLILHYDLFNNYLTKNSHQNILRIIEQFEFITIITLFVPSEILLSRIQLRIIKTLIKLCLKPSYLESGSTYLGYQWDKYKRYRRSDIAHEIYQEWFEFTKANWVLRHWILNSSQKQLEMKSVRALAAK